MGNGNVQMSKIVVICLIISLFLAACSSSPSENNKSSTVPPTELEEVKKVAVSFFNALQNFSDYDTYMSLSEDLRYRNNDERAKVMKGAFSEPDMYEILTNYEIHDYIQISANEYHATVSQTIKDIGEVPAYAIPIIKKDAKWIVLIEQIELLTSEYLKDHQSLLSSPKVTVLAQNNNITVIRRETTK
ncbi:hypothetical protein [Paenibacillus marinisediminis]